MAVFGAAGVVSRPLARSRRISRRESSLSLVKCNAIPAASITIATEGDRSKSHGATLLNGGYTKLVALGGQELALGDIGGLGGLYHGGVVAPPSPLLHPDADSARKSCNALLKTSALARPTPLGFASDGHHDAVVRLHARP